MNHDRRPANQKILKTCWITTYQAPLNKRKLKIDYECHWWKQTTIIAFTRCVFLLHFYITFNPNYVEKHTARSQQILECPPKQHYEREIKWDLERGFPGNMMRSMIVEYRAIYRPYIVLVFTFYVYEYHLNGEY